MNEKQARCMMHTLLNDFCHKKRSMWDADFDEEKDKAVERMLSLYECELIKGAKDGKHCS